MNKFIDEKLIRFWLVHQTLAFVFGKTGNPNAVKALIKGLKDKDERVRGESAKILGKIGDSVAIQPLAKALRDSSCSVRIKATEALGKIGNPLAVHPLIEALNDAYYKNVRENAVYALKHIGTPDAIKPLTDFLKNNTDAYLRGISVEALAEIGGPAVFNTLISALKDINEFVQIKAIEALEKIGNPDAVQLLIDTLKDNKKDVRMRAVKALGKIGGQDVVQPLINTLKDPDYNVHLGGTGVSIAIQTFIEALKYHDETVCVSAAEVLAEIGDTVVIHPIIESWKYPFTGDNRLINRIITLNKPVQESHPNLMCGKCLLKTKNKRVKHAYTFTACRSCNSCLHLIRNVRKIIGLIGGDIENFLVNNDQVYISLWSETQKKSRNADIDVLEIRETRGISYEYGVL